jgi:CheY-like chemotaxis protein
MCLIVVVEDDALHARLLRGALRGRLPRCAVEWLDDGSAAARRLADREERVPQLLVLDLDVPGRSGHELLELRAGDERLASIPAVVVTASDAEGDRERSLALGAAAHLSKPTNAEGYEELAGRLVALLA